MRCSVRIGRPLPAPLLPRVRRLAAALATLVLPVLTTAADTPWNVVRAVETALENSPEARIALHRLAAARALVEQARSQLWPHVSLSGGYTQTNSPMLAFGSILNQRAFDFGLDFNHPGTIDNLNATAAVSLQVYSGGRVEAGVRAARAGVAAAEHEARAVRHELIAGTVAAYLNVLKAREAVAAVEAGVRAYEAAVAQGRARREAGQLLQADLLSLEVQLAQTRENLITARHSEALAERAFLYILGMEADSGPIELTADDPALASLAVPESMDFSRRPELLRLRENERAAAELLRVARAGRHPGVNLVGSVQHDRGWDTDADGTSWMAGVAVQLDVFDGGATTGRIREAEARLAEAVAMRRKVELGLGLEVERARLRLAEAQERLAVSATAVMQAEESAALSRARFAEGALLTADLIGVEGRLIEARMRRAVAEADERIALVELRRAVGLEPFELPDPPSTNDP